MMETDKPIYDANILRKRVKSILYENLYKRPRKTPQLVEQDEDSINRALIKAILPKIKRLPWDWIISKVRDAIREKLTDY